MEENGPGWLTEDFLRTALTNEDVRDAIEIRKYDWNFATAVGDNYCSIIYRIKVSYLRKDIKDEISQSLMVKAPLVEKSAIQNIVDEAKFLQNECNIYTQIQPRLSEATKYKFCPKSFPCKLENFLIMEDLKEEGYIMCNRLKLLDYSHCRLLFIMLAKFHASTFSLHKTHPELVESNGTEPLYRSNVSNTTMNWLFSKEEISAVINLIGKIEGKEDLALALEKYSEFLGEETLNFFKRRGKINVLNHGDCWTNNILFQYKDGKVTDCRLIDFQIRRYGSLVIDLIYFLITSPDEEVRQKHVKELINVYRETLNTTMAELGCTEHLSAAELEEELFRAAPWAIHIISSYLLLILLEPVSQSDNSTQEKVETSPKLLGLKSKTFNALLPTICDQMIHFGIMKYLSEHASKCGVSSED